MTFLSPLFISLNGTQKLPNMVPLCQGLFQTLETSEQPHTLDNLQDNKWTHTIYNLRTGPRDKTTSRVHQVCKKKALRTCDLQDIIS